MLSRVNIDNRLAKLERQSSGGHMYVVEASANYDGDIDAFLRGQGHAPDSRDLVVWLRRFEGELTEPRVLYAKACR
jgi:hypothetical protein